MQLKITTPNKIAYQGEIQKITLPTEQGETEFSEGGNPMVASLKGGILHIDSKGQKAIYMSIAKGMMFADGKTIRIVTPEASETIEESTENLSAEKHDLEQKIKTLKGASIEEIAKYTNRLEKINADLMLSKLQFA